MKKIIYITLLSLLVLTGCTTNNRDNDKTIVIGATPTPHAIILEQIKDDVEALGYTLEIVEFTDYILPNTNLDAGDLDANYFQHVPYLTSFNNDRGTKLSSVLQVHFEPLGLYPGQATDIEAIANGGVVIAIPNDPTN